MLLQYFCSYTCYSLLHGLNILQNNLSANKSHGWKKNSVAVPEAVFAPGTGDVNIQSDSHSTFSPVTSNNRQTQETTREEWAATIIQTAFRAFLV